MLQVFWLILLPASDEQELRSESKLLYPARPKAGYLKEKESNPNTEEYKMRVRSFGQRCQRRQGSLADLGNGDGTIRWARLEWWLPMPMYSSS